MPEQALLYRGSVKDVHGVQGQDPYTFVFSDRYSIFDWGEMPDALPLKGEALSVMCDLFFRFLGDKKNWESWQPESSYDSVFLKKILGSSTLEKLRAQGVQHHSFGLVDESGSALPLGKKSNRLSVRSLPRISPPSEVTSEGLRFDYSAYSKPLAPMLVPLEVVFRFGAPKGSSYLKRVKVQPDTLFSVPVAEYFTKLEPTDRFLQVKEAMQVSGCSESEFAELQNLTLLIAMRLRDLFASLGLELWDGKFEFAFVPGNGEREFMLVDSIGPDELRLLAKGVHFSKELLRLHYRDSDWAKAVEKAKKLGETRGTKEWKRICREELGESPLPLEKAVLEKVSALYPALAEALAEQFFGVHVYPEMPKMKNVITALETLR
jgi:phosphoribosylaminoimidazole-succinocarboxamide synthase